MMPNKRKNLLLFSLAAEILLSSYGLLIGEQSTVVSVLYLLAGIVFLFCVVTLPEIRFQQDRDLEKRSLVKVPLLLLMILLAFFTSRYWLDRIPLDPDFADMLPIMKVMNERLLHGQLKHVYDPIPEIWNGVRPIYLPAMWLPYLPALILQFDMRWITVGMVLISFTIILAIIRIRKNRYFGYAQLIVFALLFWWIFSRNDVHGLISMSEEGVVIFYFVLLTLAIISENPFFLGISTAFCLLSRYSMIGWLIPCIIYFIIRKDFRRMRIFIFTCASCVLLLFLIPFGFKTLEQMILLPGNYIAFARHVWEYSSEVYWLNPGLAKFYGPKGMVSLHHTLLILSFGVPLLFMCFCLFQKKIKLHNINLACFKVSLLVFYQFVDVPYGYLFFTCSFVSMVIAARLLRVW
jgi:hypothetical protein